MCINCVLSTMELKFIMTNFAITGAQLASLFALICSFRGCLAQSDPFTTKPQTKYVFTGHNVSLNCGVWNGGSTVQWRTTRGIVADNIQGVYPTYRSYYDLHVPRANHYVLVVLRARSNDAGRYTCSTFDATGTTAHAYAEIAVITSPTCNEGGDYGDVIEQDRLSLSCSMNYYGSWIPVQSWTNSQGRALQTDRVWWRPSNVIRHSYSKRVERYDNDTRWIVTTTFKPKQLGNGGTYPHYHSIAVPDFRHVYTSTLIVVQFSVRNIQLENIRYSYYPGNTITCSAEGFPVPSFRWSDGANNTLSYSSTLTIAAAMEGRNTFTCEATNVVKNNTYKISRSHTFYVIVDLNSPVPVSPIEPPQPSPVAPITEPPQIPPIETPSSPPIPPTPATSPVSAPPPMVTSSTTMKSTKDRMGIEDSGTSFPPIILPSVAQSPPKTVTTTTTTVPTTIITTETTVTTMTTSSPHPHPHNIITTQTSIENAREMNVTAIVGGTTSTITFLLLVIVFLIGVICYMHIRRKEKEKPGEDEEQYAEISPPPIYFPPTQNTDVINTNLNRTSPNPSSAQDRYEPLQEHSHEDRSYDALQIRTEVNGYISIIRDSHNGSNVENEQLDSVETRST